MLLSSLVSLASQQLLLLLPLAVVDELDRRRLLPEDEYRRIDTNETMAANSVLELA